MILKNNLKLALFGNDLFRGSGINSKALINTISFNQIENPDSRRFGLSIIYNFNNYKKKSPNDNSAQDEINRMNDNKK